MTNSPPNSSRSRPHESRNQRVDRRNTRPPRASPYPSPNVQETTHLTVPVLTSQVYHQEQRLESLEREQHRMTYLLRQALDRIAQLQQEQEDSNLSLSIIQDSITAERGADELLRERLEECEQRSQEAEQYARELEQRLTLAEDNAGQASRLTGTVERLVTLMEQINLHQD